MRNQLASSFSTILFTAANINGKLTLQPGSAQTIVQYFGREKINRVYSRPDGRARKLPGGMQPFFTTKPTGEGTGLGLSLSYDIVVKGHGGIMQMNSVEGGFTEFTIQIPNNEAV